MLVFILETLFHISGFILDFTKEIFCVFHKKKKAAM